jgi:hypothetical protein
MWLLLCSVHQLWFFFVLPMWRHCSTNVTSLFYQRDVIVLPKSRLFSNNYASFYVPICHLCSTNVSYFFYQIVFVLPIWRLCSNQASSFCANMAPFSTSVVPALLYRRGTFLLMVHFYHFASAQISFYSRCVPSGSSAAAFFTFSLFLIDMSRGVLLSGDFSCKFVKSKISRQPFVFVCLFWA